MYAYIYIHTYVHTITTNKKEGMNLKKSREEHMRRFGEKEEV